MQLMPGESVVASLGNITLTTRRIQYERREWGSKKVTTITLDDLTSCDIEARSKPRWIVFGALACVLAMAFRWSVLWVVAVLFFLVWFLSRRKAMVLRSASEKIEYFGSLGQWSHLQQFLHKVQTAKADRESIATGRHEQILAAVRSAAAPTRDQPVTTQPMPQALPQAASPEQGPETPAASTRPLFWTAISSTLDSSGLVSSAAPPTAPVESAPKETSSQRNTTSDASAQEQDDSFKVAISPIAQADAEVSDTTVESQQNASSAQVALPDRTPADTFEGRASSVPDALPGKPRIPKSRLIILCLSVIALVGVTSTIILLLGSRPGSTGDVLTPRNREAVEATLHKWSESFRTGDAVAHVDCYAPVLEIYFKNRQLSREQLLRDKQKAFSTISVVTTFDLSDIQLSPEPNGRIAATFQKNWDYSMNLGKGFVGSEIEKLTFENLAGDWKIVKEEELRIVRVAHPVRDGLQLNETATKRAGTFRYVEYRDGYLAEELCSQSTPVSSQRHYCYPYGWRDWLKDLRHRTADSKANALDRDTGTESPGNLVIWWDSEARVVFSGCRPHDCPKAGAYFIVAPRTRQMDIVWYNEKGVSYFGPNQAMLQRINAFALFERINRGETD